MFPWRRAKRACCSITLLPRRTSGRVFWLRRLAALEGEQAAVEYWQVKRDGQRKGVVEIDLGGS